MDWLSMGLVTISLVIFAAASWSDWKTREASDRYWLLLGGIAIGALALQLMLDAAEPIYFLILVPVAIIFFDIFWDRKGILEDGVNILPLVLYGIAGGLVALLLLLLGTDPYLWQLMTIPIMMLLFMLFYYLDIIKGGADAKALIALSILFFRYPSFASLPVIEVPVDPAQYLFPFALTVLFNAALLMLAFPIMFFFINLSRGDRKVPAMFLGYRMDIAEARKKFVWPMEYLKEGKRMVAVFPKGDEREEELFDDLEKAGADRIWVTPKVPFLIPLTASLLFSILIGNIVFLFLRI